MPGIDTSTDNRLNGFRTSPVCIAVATPIAAIGIWTAFFFVARHIFFDIHQRFFATNENPDVPMAQVYILFLVVAPASVVVLAACIDRSPAWWLGLLTAFCSIFATMAFLAFPALRRFLPVSFLTSGTNSPDRWYLGAAVQLVIALCLLMCFRRPKTRSK